MPRLLLKLLSAFALTSSLAIGQAPTTAPEVLPPVALRGYGQLGGKWQTFGTSSLLQIDCDSEDKAKIVHAKYQSDLQELPGVQPLQVAGANGMMSGYTFNNACFLAVRDGKEVYILTAASNADLASLGQRSLPQGMVRSKPEVDVPMFLDRWDKYGFRFYYDTRSFPDNKNYTTYDKGLEFDWSVKNGTGLQTWDPVYEFDVGQGVTSRNDIEWATNAARDRHIPLGINLSTNNQVWLENWYPDEMAQHMPEFLGAYYNGPMVTEDGMRFLSWNAGIGEDMQLASIQQDVKHFTSYDNVTSWLEPHGEMGHGDTDFLLEYGPVADKTFRQWLKNKYQDVQTVSERWTGKPDSFPTWDDIHVPEMASFCGWGPDALDLTGTWKVNYLKQEVKKGQPIDYPNETFSSAYDDSSWPEIQAPGDAHASFLPLYKPAVFRRTFNVDAAWLQAHPRTWLYLFDLNRTRDKLVIVTLNGKEIGRDPVIDPTYHRGWYEATSALRPGANTLVLALPDGYLAYRVYFSGAPPRYYPDLGGGQDAHWADFADWAAWSRVQKVQRGLEMIRQVDPNRGIILMSPASFFGGEQELAKEYGGDFHDTGGMAGWWNDVLPMLMNGVGLPSSVEPGGPAEDVKGLDAAYGFWSTEGVNAIDYFITLGSIFWNDSLKADFEANLNLWKLIGKDHFAPAQCALLFSGRDPNRLSYPWNNFDKNLAFQSGYVPWGWHDDRYPGEAAIGEEQFLNNYVDRYKVVIDTNTSILDQDMVDAIERYVKQGGIFVTYVQTGRHSPEKANSWPISKLTGYEVTSIDPFPNNGLETGSEYTLAPGQTVYPPDKWNQKNTGGGAGLHLRKVAPECQDLFVWKDGTIAGGMRPLGKGYIIDLGVHNDSVGWGETQQISQILDGILDFAKIPRDPVELQNVALPPTVLTHDANTRGFFYRHFLSNNGLFDVFTVWNSNVNPLNADVVFPPDGPASATIVKTGASIPLVKNAAGMPTLKLSLAPNESAAYLTPRPHLENAARAWFDLQREWWKGTTQPPANHLPGLADIHRDTVPLSEDWRYKELTDKDDAATLAAPDVDDSAWEKRDFDATLIPLPAAGAQARSAVFRKKLTVPATWTNGSIVMYMTCSEGQTILDSARVYIDGSMVKPSTGEVMNESFNDRFKPGTTYTVAIEIQSKSCLLGSIGNCWLYYRPTPTQEMDLAGDWQSSLDKLHFDGKTTIPGPWSTSMARGVIQVPASAAKQTTLLHIETGWGFRGAIVNGTWISQSHVSNCPSFDLNITRWIKAGQDNRLELVSNDNAHLTIHRLALDFYDPGAYP